MFSFDRVFDGTAKQQEIYSSVVAPMVERVLEVGPLMCNRLFQAHVYSCTSFFKNVYV